MEEKILKILTDNNIDSKDIRTSNMLVLLKKETHTYLQGKQNTQTINNNHYE